MIDAFMSQDVHEERIILKVDDAEKLQKQLVKQGCVRKASFEQQETYLEQPQGEILKILEQEDTLTLVRLHQNDGKLDVVREKPLTKQQADELKDHYSVNLLLSNKITTFTYGEVTVQLITNQKGTFLTLQAETIGDEIYEELGLNTEDILQTSFAFL